MEQVTVIIPCYNAEAFIKVAIDSALNQTVPVKVVVVDDCSTDGSFALLQSIAETEPRLTAVRQPKNGGPSAARNTALRLVTTPWVANLDADDYMLPGRLQKLVAHGEAQKLDFVADDVIRVEPGQSPGNGIRVWKDELFGAYAKKVPVGRVGQAEDCAKAALYLMTTGFVTGPSCGLSSSVRTTSSSAKTCAWQKITSSTPAHSPSVRVGK